MTNQTSARTLILGRLACLLLVAAAILTAVGNAAAQSVSLDKPNAAANKQPALEARLERLENLEQIRDLLSRYMHYLDGRAYLRYSQLFTKDGELIVNKETYKGPDAILKMLGRGQPTPDTPPVPGAAAHMHSDLIVELNGTTATTTARWTMVSPGPDKAPRISGRGHYNDVLVRENGTWRFKKREIVTDLVPPPPATN